MTASAAVASEYGNSKSGAKLGVGVLATIGTSPREIYDYLKKYETSEKVFIVMEGDSPREVLVTIVPSGAKMAVDAWDSAVMINSMVVELPEEDWPGSRRRFQVLEGTSSGRSQSAVVFIGQ